MLLLEIASKHEPLKAAYNIPDKQWAIFFSRSRCTTTNYSQKFSYQQSTSNLEIFLPVESKKPHYICFFAPEMELSIAPNFLNISKLSIGTTNKMELGKKQQNY